MERHRRGPDQPRNDQLTGGARLLQNKDQAWAALGDSNGINVTVAQIRTALEAELAVFSHFDPPSKMQDLLREAQKLNTPEERKFAIEYLRKGIINPSRSRELSQDTVRGNRSFQAAIDLLERKTS